MNLREKMLDAIEMNMPVSSLALGWEADAAAEACYNYAIEYHTSTKPTHTEQLAFFKSIGYIPIGHGGIFSNGKCSVILQFKDNETNIDVLQKNKIPNLFSRIIKAFNKQ